MQEKDRKPVNQQADLKIVSLSLKPPYYTFFIFAFEIPEAWGGSVLPKGHSVDQWHSWNVKLALLGSKAHANPKS